MSAVDDRGLVGVFDESEIMTESEDDFLDKSSDDEDVDMGNQACESYDLFLELVEDAFTKTKFSFNTFTVSKSTIHVDVNVYSTEKVSAMNIEFEELEEFLVGRRDDLDNRSPPRNSPGQFQFKSRDFLTRIFEINVVKRQILRVVYAALNVRRPWSREEAEALVEFMIDQKDWPNTDIELMSIRSPLTNEVKGVKIHFVTPVCGVAVDGLRRLILRSWEEALSPRIPAFRVADVTKTIMRDNAIHFQTNGACLKLMLPTELGVAMSVLPSIGGRVGIKKKLLKALALFAFADIQKDLNDMLKDDRTRRKLLPEVRAARWAHLKLGEIKSSVWNTNVNKSYLSLEILLRGLTDAPVAGGGADAM